MGRIWRICIIAYLVCGLGLVGGSAPGRPSAPDWGEDLGADMCPECKSFANSGNADHYVHEKEEKGSATLTAPISLASIPRDNLHEEVLGSDMCPECRAVLIPIPKSSSSNYDVEHTEFDTCPECRTPAFTEPGAVEHPSNCAEPIDSKWMDDLGVDMCPECRPLPTGSPKQPHEEDQEVDMHSRVHSSKTNVPGSSPGVMSTPIEDLGTDMCPECRPLQSTTPSNFAQVSKEEDAYGVDMCPECRLLHVEVPNESAHKVNMDVLPTNTHPRMTQHLLEGKDRHVLSSATALSSVVLELQKLALIQQAQLDQLDGLLQKLGRPHPVMEEAKAMNFPKEQDSSRGAEQADIATARKLSERRPVDGVSPPLDSTNIFEPRFVEPAVRDSGAAATSKYDLITIQQANKKGSTSNGGRGMTVARYKPAWSEHFSFLSAVKVDGEVSCLHLLPQEGEDGTSRYVVIGDTTGRLYIFLWLGDLLLDYRTLSTSPVTAMVSYTLQKNETILVTGHSDGAVLVHQVWEKEEQGSISDDGRMTLFSIVLLHTLVPPARNSLLADPVSEKPEQGMMHLATSGGEGGGEQESVDDSKNVPVTSLEMYKVGKMRYTVVGDASGKIQLFRDNGSLHGVVQSPSRPLAFMRIPSAQRFIFLTEVGVGLLDFRSMQMRSYPCEGLNGSAITAYSFDVVVRSKAHGFTSNGDLVSVALSGDMLHFECHVKRKRKLEVTGPFIPQALKGYLIAATRDRVVVFNTTLPTGLNYASFRFVGPTPLFSATMDEIALSFLPSPVKHSRWPVLATNRDKLVVVGFGDGYVGIFRSNLPTTKPADFTAKFWNSSILVSALAILVVWQLIGKKRDPSAVTVPDHTMMTPSGASAFDKEESARLGFEQQARKGAEPSRYGSPTRGYVDTKSASFGSDSHFFRSPTVDTGIGYSGRRQPLFSSTQPVGDLELRQ